MQDAIGHVQALGQTSEIAMRCETKGGKKSKMIGTRRPGRKPLSEDLERRLKTFVLKQQVRSITLSFAVCHCRTTRTYALQRC